MSKMHNSLPLAVDSALIRKSDVGKMNSLIERPKEMKGRTKGSREEAPLTKYVEWEKPLEASVEEVGSVGEAWGRPGGLLSINLENKVPAKRRQNSPVQAAADKLTQLFVHSAPQPEPNECQRPVRRTMLSWHSRRICQPKRISLSVRPIFFVTSLACDFMCAPADDMRTHLYRMNE
jgi:hypothetical protein